MCDERKCYVCEKPTGDYAKTVCNQCQYTVFVHQNINGDITGVFRDIYDLDWQLAAGEMRRIKEPGVKRIWSILDEHNETPSPAGKVTQVDFYANI